MLRSLFSYTCTFLYNEIEIPLVPLHLLYNLYVDSARIIEDYELSRILYEPCRISFVCDRFLDGLLSEAVTKYLWTKEVPLF